VGFFNAFSFFHIKPAYLPDVTVGFVSVDKKTKMNYAIKNL